MEAITRVFGRLYLGDRSDAEMLTLNNPWHISAVISLCEKSLSTVAPRFATYTCLLCTAPVPGVQLVCLLGQSKPTLLGDESSWTAKPAFPVRRSCLPLTSTASGI